MKKKGFTLIELIAVLVIMAILALIVTPIVMSIINKARVSADKRSIDAYGRSIEIAMLGYLLDNGDFPESIEDLTIEYSGPEVVCSTTQLKSDSTVYLAGCTVGGRAVDGYTYGSDESSEEPSDEPYEIGDKVTYNNVTYYVIENSDDSQDVLKLVKETPLTKTEIDNLNLSGITATEENGYGKVQFGSTSNYSTSTIKQVVDAWASTAVRSGDTVTARLISHSDLIDNLGYINSLDTSQTTASSDGDTPSFVYNSNYSYWTMSKYNDSSNVWYVTNSGNLNYNDPSNSYMVRPVLEIPITANITRVNG